MAEINSFSCDWMYDWNELSLWVKERNEGMKESKENIGYKLGDYFCTFGH